MEQDWCGKFCENEKLQSAVIPVDHQDCLLED